jgi:hypothetical protein
MDHSCHVDRKPCEVVTALSSRFRPPLRNGRRLDMLAAADLIRAALPCPWCREVDRAASSIKRVRLGRHERNILLHAPSADSREGAILDPSLKTHSDRETYLRAVRKLSRAGLVRTGQRRVAMRTLGRRRDGMTVERAYTHRTMWLTPFGAQVVACYRRELEEGRPIRWALHRDRAAAAARAVGADLLERYAVAMESILQVGPWEQASDEASRDAALVARRSVDAARRRR